MPPELEKHPIKYIRENMAIAVGLVLIWRGIWYILDALDKYLWGDPSHIISATVGIVLGVIILYLPHHNLKALERL
ncbi:hypothetical protein A2763_03420 [Candidatus Kaiserbacteria bacterium RIFCSPHIGHO2_01_FULL_54_36]|uniref:Uncharacterized protein n=1 Tax=Candidatus Kaiserbacteria bacterium RIFCSPHIGHO2_01_FULL_54_36 TaxID=1798482 RepID=A0A1F6CLG5_9BACT|nr:MAG: hypothetical protein A2763_03420 [Candidatus Kaiserbacteria bacterium RIFCSPHIGHO2_01_FULL_54_36]